MGSQSPPPGQRWAPVESAGRSGRDATQSELNFEQILAEEPELPPRGVKIGEYEVVLPIGEGAYSVVYLAYHERLDREVALKIVRPSAARQSPGLPQRFLREIDMVSRLGHPNIVCLYDFGESDDSLLWMATELIRGRMLSKIVRESGAMPFDRVRRVALQALSGLVQAHESGIVHCDLKPDNIMLTRKGADLEWVQLLDFGIAQIVAAEGEWSVEEGVQGSVQGTPRYMAPEQFKHEHIGPHTDVYALGVVIFEMLTGRPAVVGETLTEVLTQIVQRGVEFLEELEGSEIAEIVRCATSRAWGIGGDSEALEAPSSRRSGVGVAVAGVVVVVLLALVGIGFIWFGPTGGEVAGRGSKALASAVEPDGEASSGAEGSGAQEAGAGVDVVEVEVEDPEVIWTLSSQPQGATVHRSGKVLCLATPCKASFERFGEPVELTFELSGYAHETALFSPEQGGQLVVPLRRRASVGGG